MYHMVSITSLFKYFLMAFHCLKNDDGNFRFSSNLSLYIYYSFVQRFCKYPIQWQLFRADLQYVRTTDSESDLRKTGSFLPRLPSEFLQKSHFPTVELKYNGKIFHIKIFLLELFWLKSDALLEGLTPIYFKGC